MDIQKSLFGTTPIDTDFRRFEKSVMKDDEGGIILPEWYTQYIMPKLLEMYEDQDEITLSDIHDLMGVSFLLGKFAEQEEWDTSVTISSKASYN